MAGRSALRQSEGRPALRSRAELLDAAADVVRRWRSFDEYGSAARARRALSRRRPGFTALQYEKALDRAGVLFEAGAGIVERDLTTLLERHAGDRAGDLRNAERELRRRCPGFRAATYNWVLGWILYWNYLR